jgi:ATP-dependent Clp protease adaptor protein ClpS
MSERTRREEKEDTLTRERTEEPKKFKVILLNDDYTTQEFVVLLLQHVFHHGEAASRAIMLNIHQTGAGVAGVYTYEIAETKVQQVLELAQANEYPLQCTMEPEDDGKEEDEA